MAVQSGSEGDLGGEASFHEIAGVTVAPIVMQCLDRRHSAIRTR